MIKASVIFFDLKIAIFKDIMFQSMKFNIIVFKRQIVQTFINHFE